jgi:hypothetical protein
MGARVLEADAQDILKSDDFVVQIHFKNLPNVVGLPHRKEINDLVLLKCFLGFTQN